MTNSQPSAPRQILRYAFGLVLLAGLAVGCATPKQAEMSQPIGSADQKAHPNLDKLTFLLDGKPSTREEIVGLDPAQIASIHVMKSVFGNS